MKKARSTISGTSFKTAQSQYGDETRSTTKRGAMIESFGLLMVQRRGELRQFLMRSGIIAVIIMSGIHGFCIAEGIAPEKIFRPGQIDWEGLIGTWEALPDENPLLEKGKTSDIERTLITLRKDGTCRIFNNEFPIGTDGLWTLDDQTMFIAFKHGLKSDYFIYGIKNGFMITRSPVKGGKDQLWSKIK